MTGKQVVTSPNAVEDACALNMYNYEEEACVVYVPEAPAVMLSRVSASKERLGRKSTTSARQSATAYRSHIVPPDEAHANLRRGRLL